MASMGSSSQSKLVDVVRGHSLAPRAEERVRQQWLRRMIEELDYPLHTLIVERKLSCLPHLHSLPPIPDRRADIVCVAKGIHPVHPFYPLLLIECKKGTVGEDALKQVEAYNDFVGAYFVAVASARAICVSYSGSHSLPFLPSYPELMHACRR